VRRETGRGAAVIAGSDEHRRAVPRPGKWWSPELDRATVQRLMVRRDLPGVVHVVAWLAAVVMTTWALFEAWGHWMIVPVLLVHGTVIGFSYAASHEAAHGTAFSSKWLNEIVFYLTSFAFGEEPMYRRYSHGRHHAYTWHSAFDTQMPYQNPLTLRRYLRETLGVLPLWENIRVIVRLAGGSLTESEREFVPAARVNQLIWGARMFLGAYLGIVAVATWLGSLFLIVAFFGGRIAGQWVVQLFINSQHMCMREEVADHRYSTRSLACGALTRLLYWNMNFHIEHHLYPGVPFHALPTLNRLVASQLPVPSSGALMANMEILRVIRAQRVDCTAVSQPTMLPSGSS